jgi:hypothetical protein
MAGEVWTWRRVCAETWAERHRWLLALVATLAAVALAQALGLFVQADRPVLSTVVMVCEFIQGAAWLAFPVVLLCVHRQRPELIPRSWGLAAFSMLFLAAGASSLLQAFTLGYATSLLTVFASVGTAGISLSVLWRLPQIAEAASHYRSREEAHQLRDQACSAVYEAEHRLLEIKREIGVVSREVELVEHRINHLRFTKPDLGSETEVLLTQIERIKEQVSCLVNS